MGSRRLALLALSNGDDVMSVEYEHCPRNMKYYSLDECAECVEGINQETYAELWNTLGRLEQEGANMKPLGGDGSGGTTEEPIVSSGEYDSDLRGSWMKLSLAARKNITEASTQLD